MTSGKELKIVDSLRQLATPISDLKLDPANVRTHDRRNVEAISASLQRFGQQKPVVVDKDGVVIAGNGTVLAARQLGWTHLAVSRSDLRGAERTAFAIADNRTAELAAWDQEALAQQLRALQEDDSVDHLAAGFSDKEIDALVAEVDKLADEAGAEAQREIPECFQLVVECRNEEHQRELYERLTGEGLKCRLLML